MPDIAYIKHRSPTSKRAGARTPEQIAAECLAEAHGNPERAIALGRLRLREIYLAQIKRAKSDYFDRVKRASIGSAFLRASVTDGRAS
jgi:hypothetical protein